MRHAGGTSLYNPLNGTTLGDYTSLHQSIYMHFSDPGLQNSFAREYRYDVDGRLDERLNVGTAATETYHYDTYGDLARVDTWAGCSYGGGSTDPNSGISQSCPNFVGSVNYSYDAVGNRTDLGAMYYYGNRLGNFNGGFLNYDADGNVTQKYGVQPNPHNQLFYWNAESRLDNVSYDQYYTVKYEYNALGKPVKKYRQGALDRVWLWDGEQLLAEFAPSNARIVDYQYSGTDAPYAYTYGSFSADGVRYHELDALGNVIGTHEGTSVTQTVSYDAWGVPSVSGNNDSHLMWKGLMWEGDAVGLYYMRGRWYDPELGRFIQEDPIHSGVNDYVFANNDPVNGSDPSGMDGQTCTEWDLVTRIDGVEVSRDYLETTCSGGDGSGDGGGGEDGGTTAQPKPTQPKPKPIDCSKTPASAPTAPTGTNLDANVAQAQHMSQASWLNQVRPGGGWDYAHLNGQQYAAFGNFNYGATCATFFNQSGCQRGAGAAAYATAAWNVLTNRRGGWTGGPGNPFSPANVNGQPDYGDQSRASENPSVIAGYNCTAWHQACQK